MGNVTGHFEFSGTFWTVMLVVVLAGVAYMWRNEIVTALAQHRERTQSEIEGT